MKENPRTSPTDQPPGAQPGPTAAHLCLRGGTTIRCVIVEDPDPDENGLRVFWLEPVRELTPGETPASIWLDQLPGQSMAKVRWTTPPGATRLHGSISWEDQYGHRHTRRLGNDS